MEMVASRSSGKSTKLSWLCYLYEGKTAGWMHGGGTPSLLVIFVCLARWTDGRIHQFVFSLAIQVVKGGKPALAPLYLGTLCARLNKYVQNITKFIRKITESIRRYNVLTHVNEFFVDVSMGVPFTSSRASSVSHCSHRDGDISGWLKDEEDNESS